LLVFGDACKSDCLLVKAVRTVLSFLKKTSQKTTQILLEPGPMVLLHTGERCFGCIEEALHIQKTQYRVKVFLQSSARWFLKRCLNRGENGLDPG